jgi:protoheme ferro-lyase
MNNLQQLTDNNIADKNHKEKIYLHPSITRERIEKLKKTFQPFWMRGLILHTNENQETLNPKNILNQI